MKRIAILFSLFVTMLSYAQTAGYMGKRFIIIHNSFYFPAFKEASFSKRQGIMNATKCLGIEYAASNRKTFCFAVQYLLTGVSYLPATGSSYQLLAVYSEDYTKPVQLSVTEYSIALKRFNRKALAPIGFFIKPELMFLQYSIKYDNQGFYKYDNSYYSQTYIKTDGGPGYIKLNGIGLAFSVGKQRIFWDKMVVNYGVRASLCFPLLYKFSNDVEQSIANNTYDRLLAHQFLNINLGIGFLAF